jgi:hypothetical protein
MREREMRRLDPMRARVSTERSGRDPGVRSARMPNAYRDSSAPEPVRIGYGFLSRSPWRLRLRVDRVRGTLEVAPWFGAKKTLAVESVSQIEVVWQDDGSGHISLVYRDGHTVALTSPVRSGAHLRVAEALRAALELAPANDRRPPPSHRAKSLGLAAALVAIVAIIAVAGQSPGGHMVHIQCIDRCVIGEMECLPSGEVWTAHSRDPTVWAVEPNGTRHRIEIPQTRDANGNVHVVCRLDTTLP